MGADPSSAPLLGDDVYEPLAGAERLARSIVGELVGITKVSQALFAEMVKLSECLFRETLKVDYETDALVQAGRVRPIACHLVPDLVWAEIDDEHHLARAREQVYPRIGRLAGRA